ncbi:MAG TPA: MobF family relaxase [Baekduia sp.]|uniref:MobF family relaxase n=1 Tax=Baekduia sp. TaxID=2600305 RepID=UPI002D79DE7D|nr:MobF family relaxase [Baekduia sp.]HET6507386.1 MobF family relaxase [Baekduia sp.]
MLSIGKVGGGQGDPRYYIDTVAKGKDDYYTHRGEAQGQWHGHGAEDRGLDGAVEDEQFLNVLTEPTANPKKVLAYDLTFSAPKSVSIIYGIGDPGVSAAAREAHDEAIRDALDYVERHATWTRRGRGGKHRLRGDGLTIATFRHRTSRAGDPQLHTHSVVANTTTAAGSATALDGRALYAHARTAGFLYQAALRHHLTQNLGVEWEPVHNGVAEISGIDDEVLKHFSRRSQEIRERLARLGARSARAAEVAALETRKAKDYNVPTGRLREEWRARAAELGLDRQVLSLVLDRRAPGRTVEPDLTATADAMAAPGGITEQSSTFDRRDVLRDWAEAHREGATVKRIEALADRWLDSRHAIQLERDGRRGHLGGPRHSTPEMLALEDRLVADAVHRRATGVAALVPDQVDERLAREKRFAGEQSAMARSLTTSGDGVQVVRAAAGTGKTRGLTAARDAWEAAGVRVFGAALAARAAVEMESLAGIDSATIARLLLDIDQGNGLVNGSVLIVDEAGMVGSRTIDRLARHAAETQSKLVLVGDDRQLPEIDAGGAFRRLARELGAVELHQVHRQAEVWDRDALAELRRGEVRTWSEAYRDRGRLVARPTADELRDTLVDDWWEASRRAEGDDAVMIAHRRADVAELNARARHRMHRDGRLGTDELAAGERAFAVGDRVIARHNDRRADVVNGMRGEVVGVDLEARTVSLQIADGTERRLDSAYLDEGRLDHAYALTAHAAQGATVDQAFVLGSDELYREWGYTALSRHRSQARFYIVSPGSVERALPGLEPDHDVVAEDVVAMLTPSRRKELALDVADRAGAGDRAVRQPSARSRPVGGGSRPCARSRPSWGGCDGRATPPSSTRSVSRWRRSNDGRSRPRRPASGSPRTGPCNSTRSRRSRSIGTRCASSSVIEKRPRPSASALPASLSESGGCAMPRPSSPPPRRRLTYCRARPTSTVRGWSCRGEFAAPAPLDYACHPEENAYVPPGSARSATSGSRTRSWLGTPPHPCPAGGRTSSCGTSIPTRSKR